MGTMIRCTLVALAAVPVMLSSQEPVRISATRDSVVVRLRDVEIRTAIQALAPYLDRPVIVGNIPPLRVTIETPAPVPRAAVPGLLRQLLDAHALTLDQDSSATVYRVTAREQRTPAPPVPQLVP